MKTNPIGTCSDRRLRAGRLAPLYAGSLNKSQVHLKKILAPAKNYLQWGLPEQSMLELFNLLLWGMQAAGPSRLLFRPDRKPSEELMGK